MVEINFDSTILGNLDFFDDFLQLGVGQFADISDVLDVAENGINGLIKRLLIKNHGILSQFKLQTGNFGFDWLYQLFQFFDADQISGEHHHIFLLLFVQLSEFFCNFFFFLLCIGVLMMMLQKDFFGVAQKFFFV